MTLVQKIDPYSFFTIFPSRLLVPILIISHDFTGSCNKSVNIWNINTLVTRS